MKIRIKFSKHGVLKYIGHLDLMRYFQKAFRRTDIHVAYSAGFSPHMIMSFAHPLGVGLESDGEYFDVELVDDEKPEDIITKLNAQMAEGIEISKVTILSDKTPNAMSSVAAADYIIKFSDGFSFSTENIASYNSAPEILFTKETKKSEKTFNIKEFIYDIKFMDNGDLFCCVDASSSGNLKPKFLIDSMLAFCGKDSANIKYHIFRQEIYQRNNKDELVPLYVNIADE